MTNNDNSSIDNDDGLNPNEQQQEVIQATEGRLRIVAGPGTGKTETLTRRIAHLINEQEVSPESIIAFTFTEKAADELLTRVESHVGSLENRPWVGTIHSFCLELLEDYREAIFDGDHTILGEEGQLVFLYTNYNDLGLEDVRFPLDVIAAHFSKAMDLGIDPESYVQFAERSSRRIQAIPDHRPEKKDQLETVEDRLAIAKAYQYYHQEMDEQDAVDYATMIQQALSLVQENNQVREDLSDEYSHLLVDEYQDTNRTQEALVRELVSLGCDLCVVGDDDQSIYRFRGATVDNLLEFDERFKSVRTIPIETNYRSDEAIVDASQSLIQNNERRLEKAIEAESNDIGLIGRIQMESREEEAASLCDFIQSELDDGNISSPNDIALLFRSVVRDAGPYIDALRDRGLPVEVTGVADVFDDELVGSVLTVIDFVLGENTTEEVSNCGLLNLCDDALMDFNGGNPISCGHPNCIQSVNSLHYLYEEYDTGSFVNPQEFFYEVLSCFPTIEELLTDYTQREAAQRLRYLAGLSDVVDQIGEITEHTTLGYLRKILTIVEDQGVEPDLPDREGGVNIMTVHQAKGLEFGTVIIPSLVEGKFPTGDRPDPLEIPSQLRSEPEYKSGDDHISDERRLFYVAMTRAGNNLILASSRKKEQSRFVEEIPEQYITELNPKPVMADVDQRFSLQRRDDLESTSFTQISYFTQCPLRYGLLFDYGFERTDQPQFFYGISVHRTLERFFTEIRGGADPTVDRLLSCLDTEWIDRGYIGEEQETRFRNKAEEILTTYLTQHKGDLEKIAYVEHPFSILEDQVRIEGKMDRVDRLESGKLRIIDFKVGETEEPGPWEVFQLHLYALACERTLDEEVADCRFHFLSSDESLPVEYTEEVREKTLTRLKSVLTKMKEREYSPNPGDYCQRCDFRGFCPAVDTDNEFANE